MANHSTYTPEFRRAAAAEVAARRDAGDSRTLSAVANRLNVNPSTLRNWLTTFFPDKVVSGWQPPVTGLATRSLLGLARHARCGTLLRADSLPLVGRVYTCPRCRTRLNGLRVNVAAEAAVTACAPQLAQQPRPTRWEEVLIGLRVDDRCRIVALTWRPRQQLPVTARPTPATPSP